MTNGRSSSVSTVTSRRSSASWCSAAPPSTKCRSLPPKAASIETAQRHFTFRYRSPSHFVDVFRTYYGPMLKAFAALDDGKRRSLSDDLHALIGRLNRAEDGTMVVPGEYLETVIVRS